PSPRTRVGASSPLRLRPISRALSARAIEVARSNSGPRTRSAVSELLTAINSATDDLGARRAAASLCVMADTNELLDGPLTDQHRELGASFAGFGGWNMPVSYSGTVAEHNAVRNAVAV